MPEPVVSLAVWSPLFNTLLLLSVGGPALIQVVVSMMDRPHALVRLRRFAGWLTACTGALTLLVTATPIGALWFGRFSGLEPALLAPARAGMWLAILYPPVMVLNGLYQGVLAHARKTHPITEAVVISTLASLAIYSAGVLWGRVPGIYVGVAAFAASSLLQTAWLWHRTRRMLRERLSREQVG
jgi:O-antigen/teichoic acid export membrane protein